ncbi:tetratricopeptide repeat-containing glycosyltransferase family protein [Phenylobacterium sp.]|jgi:tetratricopeptide (TPR) repeat protein|uniref:tetratricopeptide repeat-containing glycosyltransferase family protein n=1 Tax=Phenylobacterium sp. TaxID=1871053 RepID=UPI002F3F4E54
MPRQAPDSDFIPALNAPATAAATPALQTAAPTPQRITADALGTAGSSSALAKLNSAVAELKAISSAPMLQRAIDCIHAADSQGACEWALKALEQDERSGLGWYLLGIALERCGDFANSIRAYESALKLLPDHAEVANDLGRLAFRMGMTPQAEAFFRLFLERYPDHPEGANNLACAVRDQGRHGEAIEILRSAIMKAPEFAMLWNTLGTVVSEQGDFVNALQFVGEAVRLDPAFPKARYNRGNAKLMLNDPAGALEDCEAALDNVLPEDERQMMRLSRSTILLNVGRIGEGWDEYEARLHPQFSDRVAFAVDLPRWNPGEPLAGKRLLAVGEQGLGDEVLFGNVLPELLEALGPDGKLSLAVETRLVPLFQRSFPDAAVSAHATYMAGTRFLRAAPVLETPDVAELWTPMGSLLREFRRSLDAFPTRESFLTADPKRVAHWRKELKAAPKGLKVGLLWKSAVGKDNRHRFFSPFETWAPVLAQAGVTFVNLQYGDCAAELEQARRDFGVEIWSPPGIDLKQDLDDVAALSSALDLVVGFSNATLNIAAACGTPAFLISTPGAWPRMGQTKRYPWYPRTEVFLPPAFGQWEPVMAEVADAVGGFVKER